MIKMSGKFYFNFNLHKLERILFFYLLGYLYRNMTVNRVK